MQHLIRGTQEKYTQVSRRKPRESTNTCLRISGDTSSVPVRCSYGRYTNDKKPKRRLRTHESPASRCGGAINGTVAAGRSHTYPNPTPFSSSRACCSSRRGRWKTFVQGLGERGARDETDSTLNAAHHDSSSTVTWCNNRRSKRNKHIRLRGKRRTRPKTQRIATALPPEANKQRTNMTTSTTSHRPRSVISYPPPPRPPCSHSCTHPSRFHHCNVSVRACPSPTNTHPSA